MSHVDDFKLKHGIITEEEHKRRTDKEIKVKGARDRIKKKQLKDMKKEELL